MDKPSPYFRNGVTGASAKRTKVQEALHQSEERFRLLVESSPNALVMVDRQGIITLLNRRGEHLFGYSREELVGQPVELLVPKHMREKHVALRNGFLAEPVQRPLGEGRDLFAVRKDGSEVPVEIGLTPIETPGGPFVLATVTDITLRKRAQENLERLADELRRSNSDLEQFAFMVSHDLQQPLVVISGFLKLLKRNVGSTIDPESQEYLDIAYDSALHMKEMVQGMLDYARVGQSPRTFEPTNLEEVLRQALLILQEEIKRSPASFTHDPLPTVQGDRRQLERVFQNILGNALKFRSSGSPLAVHVGARREPEGWLIWVQDNGIGMDPRDKDRIFDVFQQLNPQDKNPGAGLGLAICKRIVEHHGGRIWAESRPNEGSTFYFMIPDRGSQPA